METPRQPTEARLRTGDVGYHGWRTRAGVGWGIHIFTASSLICALAGLLAAADGYPRAALLWIMVSQLIDGLDGPAARAFQVSVSVPRVDGNILDLIIDYIAFVLVPALFLYRFHLVPKELRGVAICLILLSALYCFARTDLQDDESYFNGFPGAWNLVVNGMFLMQFSKELNFAAVVLFAFLTFAPIKVVHPVRVKELRKITLPIIVVWLGFMVVFTIWDPWHTPLYAKAVIMGGVLYLAFLSTRKTILVRRAERAAEAAAAR